MLLTHFPFLKVLLFVFGVFFFMQGPMVLFPILVRHRGGDMGTISYMWILMLIPEIPLVAYARRLFEIVGLRRVIVIATLVTGLRWLVSGLVPGLDALYAVQVLHGIAITGLFVGAPLMVEALVPERLRSTGQGLLSMLGTSLGGILSATLSGILLDSYGPEAPYIAGGIGLIAMGFLAPLLLPPSKT